MAKVLIKIGSVMTTFGRAAPLLLVCGAFVLFFSDVAARTQTCLVSEPTIFAGGVTPIEITERIRQVTKRYAHKSQLKCDQVKPLGDRCTEQGCALLIGQKGSRARILYATAEPTGDGLSLIHI